MSPMQAQKKRFTLWFVAWEARMRTLLVGITVAALLAIWSSGTRANLIGDLLSSAAHPAPSQTLSR